jgi:hypothetical protein
MDPKANLEHQKCLARTIINLCDNGGSDEDIAIHASELADHVVALAEWIAKGGFCPNCTD